MLAALSGLYPGRPEIFRFSAMLRLFLWPIQLLSNEHKELLLRVKALEVAVSDFIYI